MKKVRTEQAFVLCGMSTLPISKSQDPEPAGIGAQLRKKEKRILTSLKCKIAAKKTTLSILALFVSFSTSIQFLPRAHPVSISAEADTTYVMDVDLNEYYLDTHDAADPSYYAWRGKVNLTGKIAEADVSTNTIVAYLDDTLTPVFTIDTTSLTKDSENKYPITALINTTNYTRGYHTLRLYNGAVTALPAGNFIIEVPVYFEYSELATVTNVESFCNMREGASRTYNIVTAVLAGASVEILNQVVGQLVSDTGPDSAYSTNIWYQIRYTKDSTVYTGYVLSAFFKKMTAGISMMEVSATDSVIEEFLPGKTTYNLNIPKSTSNISITDLVLYNQVDTLQVFLNGSLRTPPYSSIPLDTGTNKVELKVNSASDSTAVTYTYNIERIPETAEEIFQADLAKFPESYRPALRILHSKYPNWVFKADIINFDWESVVVSGHDFDKISLIEISNPIEYKYSDEIMDGTSFVRASRAAVEYYMDPRNFLDVNTVFQFERLTYHPTLHTLNGIQNIISGSGLNNDPGMADIFLEAGKQTGVSPYHLAARSRQEVTAWPMGLANVATGNYLGANGVYKGFYNFYNIGTGSSKVPDYLTWLGLNFAKGNISNGTAENYFQGTPKSDADKAKYLLPWDTQTKAIIGGGKYIGANYINIGQDTLYLQKFHMNSSGTPSHEYMQNIKAPLHEAIPPYNAYLKANSLTNSFEFKIPVYLNMPTLKSPKPEDTNKLDTLGVIGYPLSPAFNGTSDNYSVTVPTATEKITITASTLNSKATITGANEKSLDIGDNTFVVSCTPLNGVTRNYSVKVIRAVPGDNENNLLSNLTITSESNETVLSPAFTWLKTGPFTATVADTVAQVIVAATPKSSLASIVSGTGTIQLNYGMNTLTVNVAAENKTVRTYTVNITRTIPKVSSSTFLLSDGNISGVPILTTVGAFKAAMNSPATVIKVYTSSGEECSDSALIGTGMTLKAYLGSTITEEYKITIFGDNNGDGKVNATDYAVLKIHILKLKLLTGISLTASDINKDGKVNATDYAIIKIHILKLKEISQK